MDSGFGIGEPPINFLAHHQRAGEAGAREDFEQMLGQLVSAVTGHQAILVHANPGDWGIDVLVGDLNGSVVIWQAKYFVKGFGESQKKQVRESFESAWKYAGQEGHVITKWVLCVPCSMDPPTTRWWQDWSKRKHAETGVEIELWDETGLRRRLGLPEAAAVRRAYYEPYRHVETADPPVIPLTISTSSDLAWRGGEEACFGADCYLLHDDVVEVFSSDRSWVWREATADRVEPSPARVRLRHVAALRDTSAATDARRALVGQATLLSDIAGARRLPRPLGVHMGAKAVTVASTLPSGPVWREVFGPGPGPLDRLTAAAVLAAAVRLSESLGELHRLGHSHRALSPDAIVMTGRSRDPVLRDAGLAALPPRPREGSDGYRAPEQERLGPHTPPPGAHTDLYQLAALVHHTLTGHPPVPGASLPVRATVEGFPPAVDDLLSYALALDPRRRPRGMAAFAAALSRGRRELSRGGVS
ncbi:serine/threonine protein kinase [Streptosporangium saharense]|uniref:Protein kinase domain-containing protein n=1 Tax=Streptosporangium saharense TaxID=1706840 RepID=A0A7W7QRL0_9ACTN|nr:serine/threonine protein kinase [Streptosporangium saharense]MBB4918471.1 hypothetical protein [Streptosporangium saharense]